MKKRKFWALGDRGHPPKFKTERKSASRKSACTTRALMSMAARTTRCRTGRLLALIKAWFRSSREKRVSLAITPALIASAVVRVVRVVRVVIKAVVRTVLLSRMMEMVMAMEMMEMVKMTEDGDR